VASARATALKLASMGCHIAVNYARHAAEAERTVAEIKAMGQDALAIQADISRPEALKQLFADTFAHFRRLNIFISNAARGVFGPVTRIGPNGFDLSMATGPKALLLGAQEAVKLFGEAGGRDYCRLKHW
jgi:NAD(P)-dependent dehydrogenase (short-subunit alcohol dehydrogenase family)